MMLIKYIADAFLEPLASYQAETTELDVDMQMQCSAI